MLYERARHLQSKGLSTEEIARTLLAEGFSQVDITVILGSLGLGPQPQAATPAPLALARRVMESRAGRLGMFVIGAAALGALGYLLWIVVTVAAAIFEGLSRGR